REHRPFSAPRKASILSKREGRWERGVRKDFLLSSLQARLAFITASTQGVQVASFLETEGEGGTENETWRQQGRNNAEEDAYWNQLERSVVSSTLPQGM
ncbi:unnamed protein product, partial [Choristocarpus tenellus]